VRLAFRQGEQEPRLIMGKAFYVEVVASDGLAHHIGPFPRRATAHAWIKQHSRDSNPVATASADIAAKLAAAAAQKSRTDEQLI
jgi:hypothetical protein